MIGQRFGRLVVTADLGRRYFSCLCDCGATRRVRLDHLEAGRTVSCGCFARESARKRTKHGAARKGQHSAEYTIWSGMVSRCHYPSDSNYPRYGAKGITVCARWRHDFAAFLADVGPRPSVDHSIDRKDGTLGYEPNNCRWATLKEQARNQRSNHRIEFDGVTASLAEWAERANIPYHRLKMRLRRGWSIERALKEPGRRCA